MADILESSIDAGKLDNSASYQDQHHEEQNQNGADSANQQFTNQAQNQNLYRPNVNPNLSGIRSQAPQIAGQNLQQGQQPQLQQQQQQLQQQRPLAPPLRRVDSKQGIPIQPPVSQQRPVGPSPINQQYRPPPPTGVQQQRPQPPPNWQGQQQQQQQNRPPFPPYGGANQPQNPQVRPPFSRVPGQQPVTAPGQPPYRPPFSQQQPPQQQQQQPQQQQQQQPQQQKQQQPQQFRPTSAKALPNQNLKMSSEVAKPLATNSLINVDDDDDVVIGRASTPLKSMKPIDPMTQSQYGFLDNSTRNGLQNNDMSRSVIQSYEKDIKTKPESDYQINQQNKERKDNTINDSAFKSSISADHQSKPTSVMSNYDKQNIQKTMNISNVPTKQNDNIAMMRNEDKQKDIIKQNVPMPNPVTMNKPPVVPQSMVNKIEDNHQRSSVVKNATNMKNELQNKNDANKKYELLESKQKLHNKNKKGDNDSGVDESTQGNERNGPGSPGSPLKSPTKSTISRPPSATPSNKSRSASRSRLLKTPEPEQVKKVPMNKIQVGNAPSPNLKAVKSKIGSLENTSYKPGGGNVKIETKKIEIKATPRIEAKNDKYIPKGGEKKIISTKLQWNAKSKIGSLENAHHKPGGGDKKIESLKTDFKDKAKPKVGSKDNVKHVPRGGDIKENLEMTNDSIQTQKLDIKAQSKVGSLDNVKHKPGGGDKKIFDDKEYLKNIEHPVAPTPPSQSPIPPSMTSSSGADENLNQQQS